MSEVRRKAREESSRSRKCFKRLNESGKRVKRYVMQERGRMVGVIYLSR